MRFRQIIPDVYQLSLRTVNCFLLQTEDGAILVDCGMPEHGVRVLEELRAAGVETLSHILLTHCHPDHTGGAAFLKEETAALTWAHAEDASLIEDGRALRPLQAAPGRFNQLLFRLVSAKGSSEIPACAIDRKVDDGHLLPGGLLAIHTPGHSLGHVAYFWPEKRVLLAGDVASHLGWLRPSPWNEDFELGLRSLRKLGGLRFDIALFGHGTPIRKEGSFRFRHRFGSL